MGPKPFLCVLSGNYHYFFSIAGDQLESVVSKSSWLKPKKEPFLEENTESQKPKTTVAYNFYLIYAVRFN